MPYATLIPSRGYELDDRGGLWSVGRFGWLSSGLSVVTNGRGTQIIGYELIARLCQVNILERAGPPDIRFYDLRHTTASLMLNDGNPLSVVSKRLGHTKPSITLDVHGHLLASKQEQVAEVMDEVVAPIAWEDLLRIAP